jgi:transposase InsO family protein
MTNQDIDDIALFRYNLVIPLINNDFPDQNKTAYMRRIAETERQFPNGSRGYVQMGTLRDWAAKYRKSGFSGLKPQQRKDCGTSRKLTEVQKDEIIRLKTENPRRPATTIRRNMISTGFFSTGIPSESTIQRYLAKVVPDLRRDHIEDMRAFEMAHVNELWQMDTTHGPFITNDGRKRKVYIVGIIDDASRYLVGWHMSYEDNSVAVQMALKQAIETYGKPRQLYADNGKPYVNKQLALICAELGIGIRHAQIYHGNQKGKIERWFGVMKQQWMANINYDDYQSLTELKQSFADYVRDRNNQSNRNLPNKEAPIDRFSTEPEMIHKVAAQRLNIAFLHREERVVNHDGTINLNSRQYETGRATIGEKVIVRYQPDYSVVYIEWDEQLIPVSLVDKIHNGHAKRDRIRMTEDQ